MSEQVNVDECLVDILDRIRPTAGYPHLLLDSLGLIADRDVVAPRSIPAVDCAAIDGYAVRA
ncbi:MAG TPA: molybdopterin molybdenumtransferase MoeA, partial [Marmoricola sp.]|nr:molybdopterin molybdenumtransferase MoeA [Marmoricola sp.]